MTDVAAPWLMSWDKRRKDVHRPMMVNEAIALLLDHHTRDLPLSEGDRHTAWWALHEH